MTMSCSYCHLALSLLQLYLNLTGELKFLVLLVIFTLAKPLITVIY